MSDNHIIYRGIQSSTALPVLCKTLKKKGKSSLLQQFHNEYQLWRKAESDGIVNVLEWVTLDGTPAFFIEEFEGQPIDKLPDPEKRSLETHIRIAIQVITILGDIHRKNIVFGNLTPQSILYDPLIRKVKITDFTRAQSLPVSNIQQAVPISLDLLPYISPEHTGRTNRNIDHRSDFYSLGVCLYQLFTGVLPFTAIDPVEYIHHHVASNPPPAHEVNEGVPKMISRFIHKLMDKSADNRYQSCSGALHDIQLCLRRLQDAGGIALFPLGQMDICEVFKLPDKLYGREKEITIILDNLKTIFSGENKIMLISGVSGIGKSSLINSLNSPVARQKGYFLFGKFDQAPSEIPYYPIITALRDFLNQTLAEGEKRVEQLKNRILNSIGSRGSLITNVVPEAEYIIGQQPQLPPLPPKENERRFSTALSSFIHACSPPPAPLVLFLDDMQWADSGTLSFVEKYLLRYPSSGIFILGTYRSNEVTDSHPLLFTITKLKQSGKSLPILHLNPLSKESIQELLADTFFSPRDKVENLAAICLKKTDGNPFFLRQFLTNAHRQGNITYNKSKLSWQWLENNIAEMEVTENILSLQEMQLNTLDTESLNILKFAACLGNRFDLETLMLVSGGGKEETVKALERVSGIITGTNKPLAVRGASPAPPLSPAYKFSHDRLQRAAYSLLSSSEIKELHYIIGTRLKRGEADSMRFTRIFDITGHLNIGSDLITDREERIELAALNYSAGQKALSSAASHSASNYFQAGLRLLPPDSWGSEYELTYGLNSYGAEAAYMSKQYQLTEDLFAEAVEMCSSLLDEARLYSIKIRALKAQNRSSEAVECGLDILAKFSIKFPGNPGKLQALRAFLQTRKLLSGYTPSYILDLPPLKDAKISAVLSILYDIGTATYYTNPSLLPWISFKAIELSLQHGIHAEAVVMGYLTYGFLECGLPIGSIETGYQYGKVSLRLFERDTESAYPQIPYLVNNLIIHWKEHVSNTIDAMEKAYVECMEAGDFEIASNSLYSSTYRHLISGTDLNFIRQQGETFGETMVSLGHLIPHTRHRIFQQLIENLTSTEKDPETWFGEYYLEKDPAFIHLEAEDKTTLFLLFFAKIVHNFTFNNYRSALQDVENGQKYLANVTSSLFVPVFTFYSALTYLRTADFFPLSKRITVRGKVNLLTRKLKRWAAHCPDNFLHKYYIVAAEKERVFGRGAKTLHFLNKAVVEAKTSKYLQDQALAHELAASYLKEQGCPELAIIHRQEARRCYLSWGAKAKVKQLDSGAEEIAPQLDSPPTQSEKPANLTVEPSIENIDVNAMIKATKLMTGSIREGELLRNILKTLLENTGAQKGFLLFKSADEWTVMLSGKLEESGINLKVPPPHSAWQNLSRNIVHYVARTGESVVLGKASSEGLFTQDVYVKRNKPISIMCLPLVHQEKTSSIVYLENNLAPEAFSPQRQEIIHTLCSQAAISLKNSSLYGELETTVEKLQLEIKKRKETQLQLLHAEKLGALGRLSASIAHEFGNPLIGIQYLLQDILARFSLSLEDEKLIEVGVEECHRMKMLIRDMQQLNRPSSGRKNPFDPHKAIENVLLFQKNNLTNLGIKVIRRFADNIKPIMAVEDQITQVLVNITLNAVDAMTDKGGSLTISTSQDSEYLDILIRDTGTGIDESNQKNIFEPFFSTKPNVDGTGLGLPVSYSIIKNHDGDLTFSSRPGEGTTFHIKLPYIIAN